MSSFAMSPVGLRKAAESVSVGEEYVAYSKGPNGQYSPLVAVCRFDGTSSFRDMLREDISRIPDDKSVSGGWLFRRGTGSSSWVRRFALARNEFLFFFHSPHNDKPISLIPLRDTEISTPKNGDNSFELTRTGYKQSQGYEFELAHPERDVQRLYSMSDSERMQWVRACEYRARYPVTNHAGADKSKLNPVSFSNSSIVVTNVRLAGDITEDLDSKAASYGAGNNETNMFLSSFTMNPFAPPDKQRQSRNSSNNALLSPAGASGNNASGLSLQRSPGDNDWEEESIATVNSQSSNFSDRYHAQTNKSTVERRSSGDGPRSYRPFQERPDDKGRSRGEKGFTAGATVSVNYRGQGTWTPAVIKVCNRDGTYDVQYKSGETEVGVGESVIRLADNSVLAGSPRRQSVLKDPAQERLRLQAEGRIRQAKAKERRRLSTAVARAQEGRNPMVLSKILRFCLHFLDQELAEDPAPDAPLQVPHLKGEWAEGMLVSVYQRYCNHLGFMSIEQFIDFMEDSGILNTHTPHDGTDLPMEEFKAQLDPVKLLTSVPRNLGYSTEMLADIAKAINDKEKRRKSIQNYQDIDPDDVFVINFTQFYQIILRMCQIVYADVYESDPTVALHKILQEIFVPMLCWCDHLKVGSMDILVKEERIALLAMTYLPNLWKVFLFYAREVVGKALPSEAYQLFPEVPQYIEKLLHGLPDGAPTNTTRLQKINPLIITEQELMRFCYDYGFLPYLFSKKHFKELFNSLNREKKLVHKKETTSTSAPTASKMFTPSSAAKIKAKPQLKTQGGMHFSTGEDKSSGAPSSPLYSADLKAPLSPGAATASAADRSTHLFLQKGAGRTLANPSAEAHNKLIQGTLVSGGLSFSEFVEFICRVGVEGLHHDHYQTLFPTPVSKVLAVFTIWGACDLKKLEEVRALNSESHAELFGLTESK